MRKGRIGENDTWFSKFDQWPLGAVLDKLIEMSKFPGKQKGRDTGDLIYRKLRKRRKESNQALATNEANSALNKQWLFYLLEKHFSQSNGIVLTDIRMRIRDLDKAPPMELGGGYVTPE